MHSRGSREQTAQSQHLAAALKQTEAKVTRLQGTTRRLSKFIQLGKSDMQLVRIGQRVGT
jgi:hypothetical protein